MNHKPGSVLTAICLEPALQQVSMQPTRSIGRAVLLLLDFAPDEVCLFPAKPGKGLQFYLR